MTEPAPAHPIDPAALCAIAERAARAAASELLIAFRSEVAVSFKRDPHDVVTLHDRAAERTITAVLQREAPGSEVLGEEGGSTGDARLRWIVDPIDGTANFARGLAYWCISIAAELDGAVVAGVVYDPVADNMFAADADGARLDGRPLRSQSGDAAASTVLTGFPVQRDVDLLGEGAWDLLRELTARYRHHHSTGSGALNLAHVAAGWSDLTLGFDTHPWDIAAGALLLERAGGRFVGFREGMPAARAHDARDYVGYGAGGEHAALIARVRALSATIPPEG